MSQNRQSDREERVSDLFGLLYETGGKLSTVTAMIDDALRRVTVLETWVAEYPGKLQAMLKDATDEHRKLDGGIARLDSELKLLAKDTAEAREDIEAVQGVMVALETRIKSYRPRKAQKSWEQIGKAIAGILAGIAGVVGVIVAILPLLERLIVNVFGP